MRYISKFEKNDHFPYKGIRRFNFRIQGAGSFTLGSLIRVSDRNKFVIKKSGQCKFVLICAFMAK